MTPTWNVLSSLLMIHLVFSHKPDINCPYEGEYKHGLPMTSCRQYYECRGSSSIVYHACPPGTHYAPEHKNCRVGGNCYELVCAGRVDGRYADSIENCSRWYECRGGAVDAVESCPTGYSFDEQASACLAASNVNCLDPKFTAGLVLKTSNPCRSQPNGLFAVTGGSTYVKCVDQVEVETHTCPLGQQFDGKSCAGIINRYNDICASKPNGYHLEENTGCSEYVLCRNMKIVLRSKCPTGTVFDGQSCTSQQNFVCPRLNKCYGHSNGQFPDLGRNCQTYFHCKDGIAVREGTCPVGMLWNGQKCASKRDFECAESTENGECSGKRGYVASSFSRYTKYYYCNHGFKITFSCPLGLVFDGFKCVQAKESLADQSHNTCGGKPPGYYTNPDSNCRSYYYCAKGNKIVYVCPPSEVFNGMECVSTEEFTCSSTNNDCAFRPDGYQRVARSQQEYFYCSNGHKLLSLQCDDNEVFDGEKCLDVKQYRSMCRGIRYGYLTEQSCRVYYLCREETIVKSGVCLDKFVFDGKSCVPRSSATCDRGSITSCVGAPNGFYADFNTDCNQYFYCINGQRTRLQCPTGQVHNGDQCVPNYKFICPSLRSNNN